LGAGSYGRKFLPTAYEDRPDLIGDTEGWK